MPRSTLRSRSAATALAAVLLTACSGGPTTPDAPQDDAAPPPVQMTEEPSSDASGPDLDWALESLVTQLSSEFETTPQDVLSGSPRASLVRDGDGEGDGWRVSAVQDPVAVPAGEYDLVVQCRGTGELSTSFIVTVGPAATDPAPCALDTATTVLPLTVTEAEAVVSITPSQDTVAAFAYALRPR